MANVDELNQIATSVTSSGYIGFDELLKEKEIKVLKFGIYNSISYGKEREAVRVFIEDGYLILPERFDEAVEKMLNMNTENLYIIYHGRDGKGQNKRINLSFIEKKNNGTTITHEKKKNQK